MFDGLAYPRALPPLDQDFRPAVLFNHAFLQKAVRDGQPLVIGLQRGEEEFSRYETTILSDGHPEYALNYLYVERIVKFLLWQHGAYKVYIGGPKDIGEHIREAYTRYGPRKFDVHFMGDQVYESEFEVSVCPFDVVPLEFERTKLLGRHLHGCRIGFELGASDRKGSAVVDGKVVHSEEVIWEPRKHTDPEYHFVEILAALKSAASKMPRLDAIGGSSAGVYIDNRPMVASLFRGIPEDRFNEVHTLFERIQQEMQVPLEVVNDGDVTALAGSMSLEDNAVLGIALGSSEATGYVDHDGHILGWLNELAFAPIDYNPNAPQDEWSGDRGCGVSYLSQQCAFRLAAKVGINLPLEITDAEKLKLIQGKLEQGHEGALKIWQSMGVYLGYAIAHYADFYDIKHILILGRCTSGKGGDLLLEGAREVLSVEFPALLNSLSLHLPDEKVRRVGQSVAAASLPAVDKSPEVYNH